MYSILRNYRQTGVYIESTDGIRLDESAAEQSAAIAADGNISNPPNGDENRMNSTQPLFRTSKTSFSLEIQKT